VKLPGHKVIQNAYVVTDIDEAISRMTRDSGFGPWIVMRHYQVPKVLYRGEPAELDMSIAFTQAGEVQIELIQQHNDGPSCYRDSFGPDGEGFHHTAMFAPEYEATIKAYEDAGYPCAEFFELGDGGSAAYMDTRKLLGHMLELYRDTQGIHDLYAAVRDMCEKIKDPSHVEESGGAAAP
jgi:hypothetical protein